MSIFGLYDFEQQFLRLPLMIDIQKRVSASQLIANKHLSDAVVLASMGDFIIWTS